jgi:predicted RNA-binding Zn-ribbon protein involved in translation (DUF1610 family)
MEQNYVYCSNSYEGEKFSCKSCEWEGLGSELIASQIGCMMSDLKCPKCGERISSFLH